MRSTILIAAAVLCGAAGARASDNWPEFRGPRGDGNCDAVGLPLRFGETENVKWKTPIHGRGWSSPVVWGDQVWLTTATEDGKRMSALAVDGDTGKIVHDVLVFENEKPQYCHPTNSYASPTPAVEAGRVYVHFGAHGTACLDTETGRILWTRRDLPCDHFRGPGSSPILFEDLLIVHFDGFDDQYVVAFDKRTGKTAWKKDRTIDYGTTNGDFMKAYSTPTVVDVAGRKQLVSPAAVATIAYDPRSGEELWRIRHGGMNAAARPLFGHGLVYIAAGDGGMQFVAVRPDGRGDVTGTHVAWKSAGSIPKRPSQLLVGELLFMMDDNGVATCRDAKTGETHWKRRITGRYWASPVSADGRIYCFDQDGKIPVIEASRDFKLLEMNQLGDGFNASAAIVGRSLILRSKTHLYRVEEAGQTAGNE